MIVATLLMRVCRVCLRQGSWKIAETSLSQEEHMLVKRGLLDSRISSLGRNVPANQSNNRPYSKMADTRNDLGLNTWKRGLVGQTSKSEKF